MLDETLRCSNLAPIAARYSDYEIIIDGHVIPQKVCNICPTQFVENLFEILWYIGIIFVFNITRLGVKSKIARIVMQLLLFVSLK